jgi:hypothetical protein
MNYSTEQRLQFIDCAELPESKPPHPNALLQYDGLMTPA